jgi:hypothetical protein
LDAENMPFAQRLLTRPSFAAIAIMAVFVGVTLTVFQPRFETNDDAVLNAIAAGRAVTDVPDEHLVFSNFLIGTALKNLYRAMPNTPWYGLYLVATEIASLAAICYSLLLANRSAKQILLIVAFLVVFAVPCIAMIQFTSVAFLAAEAGIVLLVVGANRDQKVLKWIAIPFLTLSSLIRWDACLLACMVFSPALAAAFIKLTPKEIKRSSALVFAACLAMGWALAGLNRWYYSQSDGWRDFYEFNRLSAQIINFGRVELNERTKPAFDSVGWSAVDLEMLRHWSFANSGRFNIDKMRLVLDSVHLNDRSTRNWGDLLERLVRREVLALLAIGFIGMLLMSGGFQARLAPLASLLIAALICLLLFQFYFLPRRVYFPALSGFVVVAMAGSSGGWPFAELKSRSMAIACSVAFVLFLSVMLGWRIVRDVELDSWYRERHIEAVEMMRSLAPREDQLYVAWGSSVPWENLVVPLEPLWPPASFKEIGFGAMLATPFTRERCREFGIQDIDRALFERDDVFLVSSPELNELFKNYAAEHYGVTVGARPVFSHVGLRASSVYKLFDAGHRKDPVKQ